MECKTKIILGPPGTGKTHTLLNRVEEELARGTPPDRIAFLAFTKKAATEARDRAMKKFDLEEQHLPYFRTLHSFAFHQLGLTKAEVMSRDNYKEFAQTFGMDLGSVTDGNDSGGVFTTDNILINEVNLARMKCMELEHHYNHSNLQDVSWHGLLRAQRSLEEFKKKKEVFDFTDMIELYLESGPVPKLDVVFIDEAQDLCALQWRMVDKISQNAKKVYVCGDDDQAIYTWAGADVRHFIKLPGEIERDIRLQGMLYKRNNKLPISAKLLNAVEAWKKLNTGEHVALPDIKDIYSYMSSQIGIERGHKNLKMADKEQYELEELVMHHGLLMGGRPWDVAFDKVGNRDKEYLRAIEIRGQVSTNPKINLSTIHGAKGGEADNVMLLTDLSRKSQEAMEKDSDDECRVFYVGATRARNQLHIVQPQREGGFII